MQKPNTVKGTKDLFGQDAKDHENIKKIFSEICEFMNYENISTPILEHSSTFTKTLGVSSDIISKEMYNFVDQGNDHLVLRPEGTASVARAIITNSIQDNQNQRYYYHGPMFRREKPQSGRLRQFHQVGLETFGVRDFHFDVETILIAEKFLNLLNIRNKVKLEINSLGNIESRKKYLDELVKFLKKSKSSLSEESKKRLEVNPLRILDSKDFSDKAIVSEAPKILNYLDEESLKFFENFTNYLDQLKIDFEINPLMVRGLDYYNHTTFEYVTFEDKSQNTVLAGGRYDGLLKSLGGNALSGVGWAAGIERILLNKKRNNNRKKLICFFSTTQSLNSELFKILKEIIISENFNCSLIFSGNLKKKLNKANKLQSFGCIILGEEEYKEGNVIWKNLKTGIQESFSISNINNFILKKLENKD